MSDYKALTQPQRDDLRTIAAMIIPASDEYKVPGADDPAIQADILATLGRDTARVREALEVVLTLVLPTIDQHIDGVLDGSVHSVQRNAERNGDQRVDCEPDPKSFEILTG